MAKKPKPTKIGLALRPPGFLEVMQWIHREHAHRFIPKLGSDPDKGEAPDRPAESFSGKPDATPITAPQVSQTPGERKKGTVASEDAHAAKDGSMAGLLTRLIEPPRLSGQCPQEEAVELPRPAPWPGPMHAAAWHGLAGQVVQTLLPHSESDPAALLALTLGGFGSMAGPGPHFLVEAREHPLLIWLNLVGESAKGRKGSAWSSVRYVLERVDPDWVAHCTTSGLSSGEGLIWRVRDPIVGRRRNRAGVMEDCIVDSGVCDKRLFVIEEEFSSVLKAAARGGSTISDVLRCAWDHGDLATLTTRTPSHATGAHITVCGHITRAELDRLLSQTDALSGFGNRFLWVCVRRSKLLPEGGALATVNLAPLVRGLRRALSFARSVTLIERTPRARKFWAKLYPALTADRPGVFGAVTSRAEAQVSRLATVYAVLDCSPVIDLVHLRAGLAAWDFCERSAAYLFSRSVGNPIADRIFSELRAAGSAGLTQTQIRDLFHRNFASDRIGAALALLEELKRAQSAKVATAAQGRKAIIWKCCENPNASGAQADLTAITPAYRAFLC